MIRGTLSMACSVCFGDPASLQSQGTRAGVLFMLGLVVCVLAAIGWTAFTWARRAKKLGA